MRAGGGANHVRRAETILRLREAATKVLTVVAALGLAASLMLIDRARLRLGGLSRTEYAGKIVDKSLTIRETQLGSKMVRRLLIEGEGGERFEVAPELDVYERAQIGMRIRSDRSGVELSWPERDRGPASKAEGASGKE